MSTVEIDIHEMGKEEAKYTLERALSSLPKDVTEVRVIHGYRRGNKLADMVRKELRHKRIKRRFLTLNQGETILIL